MVRDRFMESGIEVRVSSIRSSRKDCKPEKRVPEITESPSHLTNQPANKLNMRLSTTHLAAVSLFPSLSSTSPTRSENEAELEDGRTLFALTLTQYVEGGLHD
jgi:hypothetical protein